MARLDGYTLASAFCFLVAMVAAVMAIRSCMVLP